MADTTGILSRHAHVHPKLKMFSNADATVSTIRAECSGSVCVSANQSKNIPIMRTIDDEPLLDGRALKRKKMSKIKEAPQAAVVTVFVDLSEDADPEDKLPGETARSQNIATVEVALNKIDDIALRSDVRYIQLGEPLNAPVPQIALDDDIPSPGALRNVGDGRQHGNGRGVLIGIIDVLGFDFSHADFLNDDGTTRFQRIWDQGGTERPPPNQLGFNYGSEISKVDMDAALAAQDTLPANLVLPATEIERQSQQALGSHGTHVASIAAGNLGVCPQADIAAVLIDLGDDAGDRRQSLYDSTRLAHAVEYLFNYAAELSAERGEKVPVSINISLGTNGHAHDGSSPSNRWIDHALTIPGRSVCVAAGNSGQEKPLEPGDSGFIMGRIHSSGQIAAAGLSVDLEWRVVGNTIADISENELEIWYGAQDRFRVTLISPSGHVIGPVDPRTFIENQQLPTLSFASVYNELYHPANGLNYIGVYLSPLLETTGVVGVEAGIWTVRLTGIEVRDGSYNAWIERDDPVRLGTLGPQQAWRFPSFFSTTSNVDNTSISSLATGQNVIGVANLDSANDVINISSSQGPTRDGRAKPEVAAPGTNIPAANGFGSPDDPWISLTGTSMASPYVAGVIGLMLAVEPRLTAPQIQGIIKRTSTPLPGDNFNWTNDGGFGVIQPDACVFEAKQAFTREDLTI